MKPKPCKFLTALTTLLTISSSMLFWGCGNKQKNSTNDTAVQVSRTRKPIVFVSIPPQKTFVREIGGGRPEIHVMVKPGHSPATYEPTPKQLAALASAHVYLKIGVPFESAWMDRIRANNRDILIVDTAAEITLRSMETHQHPSVSTTTSGDVEPADSEATAGHERKDPHTWLSPKLVKKQARAICNALKGIDPYNAHKYETNLVHLKQKLDDLDNYIRQTLQGLKARSFMVFHPSWGYFAEAYDLRQIAVETEGKEPGGKTLARIIDEARSLDIDTIFVQPQFSRTSAETIAKAVDAEVAVLNPLAENYFENLRQAADKLAGKE